MDDITKAIYEARAEQIDRIRKSMSNADELLEPECEIKKGEVDDQEDDVELSLKSFNNDYYDIEKEEKDADEDYEDDDDTEKSDIAEALSGYNSNIKIKKKGKEIKDHLKSVLIPELNAFLVELSGKADKLLEGCGNAPTCEPDCWWTDGIKIDCGYKVYDWREMECCKTDGRVMYATLSAEDAAEKKGNVPENEEQATLRREYNNTVRKICNVKVDLKTCEIMNNLKDNDEYELNPRQVIALRFN